MRTTLLIAACGVALLTITGCSTSSVPSTELSGGGEAAADQPKAAAYTEACGTAMKAAADVPGNMDNNPEMLITLQQCSDAQDWIAALKENPGAGSLVSYNDADAAEYLWLACGLGPSEPVCLDAVADGLISL